MAAPILDFLKASRVFMGVPAKELQALAVVAREESYRGRDFIFMEGDAADFFCVVKSGRVKILRTSRAGKEVVLELLGPGEPFGGVAVMERRPYPASAQAIEATVVVRIPREALVTVAERYPSLVREMALMIGRRLRTAHDSVQALAVDPAEARLAGALLRLAERDGERGHHGLRLPFHLTRQSLADMTGTTVETAIRILSRWQREGILQDEGGRIVIPDTGALREVADGETA